MLKVITDVHVVVRSKFLIIKFLYNVLFPKPRKSSWLEMSWLLEVPHMLSCFTFITLDIHYFKRSVLLL